MAKVNRKTPTIGSISSGTMQPRDLIPAFADALREYMGITSLEPVMNLGQSSAVPVP